MWAWRRADRLGGRGCRRVFGSGGRHRRCAAAAGGQACEGMQLVQPIFRERVAVSASCVVDSWGPGAGCSDCAFLMEVCACQWRELRMPVDRIRPPPVRCKGVGPLHKEPTTRKEIDGHERSRDLPRQAGGQNRGVAHALVCSLRANLYGPQLSCTVLEFPNLQAPSHPRFQANLVWLA